ncbi:hypothetical protein V2J09_023574 [Rumex salicifolius]
MSTVNSKLPPPEKLEDGGRWYFSRKEIEENSPSRKDGIDLKKEAYLRKAYCTFLQDLGMKLKVPQVTIATAIIFCHRFYLRQSHSKNDRKTVATACMFLAGKVEETPRPLKDVILVSFEIINKKDPAAAQKIKQKEVYEQQKELILLAERVVLATLGFDLNVQHPYKPLVEAIKKFKVAQNALAQVAWNFVNDGLRTSLCLQFKTHHIAAGAIFLAAKFLKVKLPSDGEKVWWQEFDVTPRQLEEVSNQMLELYEQNRVPPSQANEADGSTIGGANSRGMQKSSNEEQGAHASSSHAGGSSRSGTSKPTSAHVGPEHVDNGPPRSNQNCSTDNGNSFINTSSNKEDGECRVSGPSSHRGDVEGVHDVTSGSDWHSTEDDKERGYSGKQLRESVESKDKYHSRSMEGKESGMMQSTPEVPKKFDEDKLKQLREKRKKSLGDATRRIDTMDEFDPIVKELEEGVELAAAENEKSKQEKKQNIRHSDSVGDQHHLDKKSQQVHKSEMENVEEGEVSAFENSSWGHQSPKTAERKRKARSPPEKSSDGRHWHDNTPGSTRHDQNDFPEDKNRLGRHGYSDRDHKRHVPENHA